jgi:hypothetical protein
MAVTGKLPVLQIMTARLLPGTRQFRRVSIFSRYSGRRRNVEPEVKN